MTARKSREIISLFIKEKDLWPSPDLQDALKVAIVALIFYEKHTQGVA